VQIVLIAMLLLFSIVGQASEKSFSELARQNQLPMSVQDNLFVGPGWGFLQDHVSQAQQVLAGEDHFTNEIAQLISALAEVGRFDNLYIEVDPFSARIIERSIREMSLVERTEFRNTWGDLYSFYALQPEYALLEKMLLGDTRLLGTEQVVLYTEPLIFQDWLARTSNEQAREIYQSIIGSSKQHLDEFLEDQQKPFYFLTPEFSAQLDTLARLPLSEEEQAFIKAMQQSIAIYQAQSHRQRVQLLKHQLMAEYPGWIAQRNLFKFGANHLMRGESFLTVQDIGALVANLAEAHYQQSFHVMIAGESGFQASPFRGLPPTAINPEDYFLQHLQPFFELTEGDNWNVFNLLPLRSALERGEISIENQNLVRTIKGYDALVLIPRVTAAQFPEKEVIPE